MPHVDEGTLHAYLDGAVEALADAGALPAGVTRASIDAHFALCADCRAALAAERDIRERAGLVLQDAAPAWAEPPSYESLRPTTRRRTWVPLTWAATVLLAVGAGWWGRDITRIAETAPTPFTTPAITAPAVENAPPPAVQPPVPEVVEADAPPPAAARTERAASITQESAEPMIAADAATGAAATSSAAAPPALDRLRIGESERRQFNAPQPSPAPPPPPARIAAAAALAQTRDSAAWQEVDGHADAVRLAGAEIVSIATVERAPFTLARVRQRLLSGDTVDVITVQASITAQKALAGVARESAASVADGARLPADELDLVTLDAGMRELQLALRDGRIIALRARLDDATLRALVPALVPAR